MKLTKALFFFCWCWTFCFAEAVGAKSGQSSPAELEPQKGAWAPCDCKGKEPSGSYFQWTEVGVNPYGLPIQSFEDFKTRLLAPDVLEGGLEVFNKPWQRLAKEVWGWDENFFRGLLHGAEMGEGENWKIVWVGCCEIFSGQIYSNNPPRVLNRLILTKWKDRKPKPAWMWQVTNEIRIFFFVGCSNPAYQVVIPVTAKQEEEKPIPPPPPPLQEIKVEPKIEVQPTPVIVQVPEVKCPEVQITNLHPITFSPNIYPSEVKVLPTQRIEVVVKQQESLSQKFYNWTGTGFHLVAGGWLIRNWTLRGPQGPPGQTGSPGPPGPPGKDGQCWVDGQLKPCGTPTPRP